MSKTLYYGDNLEILPRIPSRSVALIYLDPPFNSNANYNIFFKSPSGHDARAQRDTFEDTWTWDDRAAHAYAQVLATGGQVARLLEAIHSFLGGSDMMAYLANMTVRLSELHRVLRDDGSLYLHCDPTASHYLKIILDGIFGGIGFRNEIVWQRTNAHNDSKRYGKVHDIIFFYTKGKNFIWNQQFDAATDKFFKSHDFQTDESGQLYRKRDLTAPAHGEDPSGQYEWKGKRPPKGRMWAYTLENMRELEREGRIVYTRTGMARLKIPAETPKGVTLQDVWTKPELWLNSGAKERVGYKTQKPAALLRRIIETSSSVGDTVLDPFCGCGTTIEVAHELNRQWAGIDVAYEAMMLIEARLKAKFPQIARKKDYAIEGIPKDDAAARGLAKDNPYAFQSWAVSLLRGGQPHGSRQEKEDREAKKGKDRGIDGLIFFQSGRDSSGVAIVSVKGTEKVGVQMIRDLRGTIEREKAPIGIFLSLAPSTKDMRQEATDAGTVEIGGRDYMRVQIYTVGELMEGGRADLPPVYELSTLLSLPKGIGAIRTESPAELRKQVNMMLPIIGGRSKGQKILQLDEPLLTNPVAAPRRSRRKAS